MRLHKRLWIGIVAFGTIVLVWTDGAAALEQTLKGRIVQSRAQWEPWHGDYYYSAWGMPAALVVPPNAEMETIWGWGVGNTRVVTIRHQFQRGYPGPGYYYRGWFAPKPLWPADTDQFGVYPVRGPW